MIKVALVTTYAERCGIAEYAKSLVAALSGRITFDIYDRDRWDVGKIAAGGYDIFHLNYEAGLFTQWFNVRELWRIKETHRPTVMTLHNSRAHNVNPLTASFDKVVVHEKTSDGFTHIPEGIREGFNIDLPDRDTLGTAGFPFPHKGFKEVAETSKILGTGCFMIGPTSRHVDTDAVETAVKEINFRVTYIKEYWPEDKVISTLRDSAGVLMFPYQGDCSGISGAVRLGLATGRPIVLTRNQMFRDLFAYEDEIEFAQSHNPRHLVDAVMRVTRNGKRPRRVISDMGWSKSAAMYEQLYKELKP